MKEIKPYLLACLLYLLFIISYFGFGTPCNTDIETLLVWIAIVVFQILFQLIKMNNKAN